ncbi:CHAT domain-containing protein [Streptomyces sp. NPDC060035]|uniref:CHAT domain-containing protein n=1 Tax=Streptomyces sp. NPDC060035 TaxID=3347044 RepID=UPI00369DC938
MVGSDDARTTTPRRGIRAAIEKAAARRYAGSDESYVGWAEVQRHSLALEPLFNQVRRANDLGTAGEVAAAEELVQQVSGHPLATRIPLLTANIAMVRCIITGAQGDLEAAEQHALVTVGLHKQGGNLPAISESMEMLGKVQHMRGRNAEAYDTLIEALEVGGDLMYRLSRVRLEVFLMTIAFDAGDRARTVEHAMKARKLAKKWRCHIQHGAACDALAYLAMEDNLLKDAVRWAAEADRAYQREEGCPLPARLRHLIIVSALARSEGRTREAMGSYVHMMQGVSELRAGWGWRDAQAYFVDLYSEPEVSAYLTANELFVQEDELAPDAFAKLLDLGNRTSLRKMLRGELGLEEPADLGEASLTDVVALLGTIKTSEGSLAGEAPPSAGRKSVPQGASADVVHAGRQLAAAAYDRLETLVSLRFRRALEAESHGTTIDAREWAVRWSTHVLQIRLLTDGESAHVAGLWTAPDGLRHPFLHSVDSRQARMLGEITGIESLLSGTEAEPAEAVVTAPGPADGTESVRADAPKWKQTARFRHLAVGRAAFWAEIATILLPAGLADLLRETSPDGEVPKLLLVPDSYLWRVPWAALRVDPTHVEGYLADRSVLALLPSLSLLTDSADSPGSPATRAPAPGPDAAAGKAVAYLAGFNPDGLALERDALNAAYGTGVTYAARPADLLNALGPHRTPASVVIASVHGDNRPGLAHALILDDHTRLSAARMLTLHFPRILMINACLSAELDERHGTDPLGIPTVALCRGAETVIGGLYPLPDGQSQTLGLSHPTSGILTILYRLLAEGMAPSSALRTAQRQWRREHGPTPAWLWAGLVSITTQFDDPHRAHER